MPTFESKRIPEVQQWREAEALFDRPSGDGSSALVTAGDALARKVKELTARLDATEDILNVSPADEIIADLRNERDAALEEVAEARSIARIRTEARDAAIAEVARLTEAPTVYASQWRQDWSVDGPRYREALERIDAEEAAVHPVSALGRVRAIARAALNQEEPDEH